MSPFADEYVRVEVDATKTLARFTRTTAVFPSLAQLERSFGESSAALERLDRARYALFVDLRDARGSNDLAFEQAMVRARRRLMTGFCRVAVLVKSASGALQVRRHAKEDGVELGVFTDEDELLAYLSSRRLSTKT